eukprot:111910_1
MIYFQIYCLFVLFLSEFVYGKYVSFGDDSEILNVVIDSHSNGDDYFIIDPSLEPLWSSYFSSWKEYHYALYGPSKHETINWDEWFIIDSSKYLLSADCNKCSKSNKINKVFGTSSGYYMSANIAGCHNIPFGRLTCDWNPKTYECHACTGIREHETHLTSYNMYDGVHDEDDDTLYWGRFYNKGTSQDGGILLMGSCGFMPNDAFYSHNSETDGLEYCLASAFSDISQTTEENLIPHSKPSIGTDGRFCVCANIDDEQVEVTYHTKIEYNKQNIDEKFIKII